MCGGCAGTPSAGQECGAAPAPRGPCRTRSAAPLSPAVLSTWHFIGVPRAENPPGELESERITQKPLQPCKGAAPQVYFSLYVFNSKQKTLPAPPSPTPSSVLYFWGFFMRTLCLRWVRNSPRSWGTGGARTVPDRDRRGSGRAGAAALGSVPPARLGPAPPVHGEPGPNPSPGAAPLLRHRDPAGAGRTRSREQPRFGPGDRGRTASDGQGGEPGRARAGTGAL